MKNSIKTAFAIGFVTAVIAGGIAVITNAKGSTAAVLDTRIAQRADEETSKTSEYDTHEVGEEAEDTQEVIQYQPLAKITSQEAQRIAEAAQDSAATRTELDEEDGSLVYEVQFANAEVIVDAGNGQILKTEAVGQEEADANEISIQGSIRIPDTDNEQGEAH